MLLKHKSIYTNIIAPFSAIFIYAFFYRTYGTLDRVVGISGFWLNEALLRGFADMNMGILAYQMGEMIVKKLRPIIFYKVVGAIGFSIVLCASYYCGYTKNDFIYLIIIWICVVFEFLPSKSKIINSKIIEYWSKLSLPIYLNHGLFRAYILPKYVSYIKNREDVWICCVIYLVIVTLWSMLFKFLIDQLIHVFKKRMRIEAKDTFDEG